jgi:hypothetical protein
MRLAAAALLVVSACDSGLVHHCANDAQCANGGEQGVCEDTGFCSFSDPSCGGDGDRRYSEWAGGAYAGRCVGATVDVDARPDGPTVDGPPGPDGAADAPTTIDGTADARPPDARPPDARPPDARPPDAPPTFDAPPILVSFSDRSGDVNGVTVETDIQDSTPTQNYGTANDFGCDKPESAEPIDRTGLLRFDLTSIPTSARVVTVELQLVNEPGSRSVDGVRVHKLLEAWTETQASWQQRTTGVNWSVIGADPPTSRLSSFEVEFFPNTDGGTYAFPLPLALVQGWVSTPSTNFGIAFECNTDDGVDFISSEATATSQRPRLRILYQP